MRAKFINEFGKGTDPKQTLDIGKDSAVIKEKMFQGFIEKGIKFYFGWNTEKDEKALLFEHIYEFEYAINLLEAEGIDLTKVSVSNYNQIKLPIFYISNSPNFLFPCLTELDAQLMVDIINNLSIQRNPYRSNFSYEKSEDTFYYLADNQIEWLKNLKNIRLKYS